MTDAEIVAAEIRAAEVPMSDALGAALDRLERDAERYRGLRGNEMTTETVRLDALVRPLVERLLDCAQGVDIGADGMGWSPDPELLREAATELTMLRSQLDVSTRGLRHCARWNISEEKRSALMAVVLESEAMLARAA